MNTLDPYHYLPHFDEEIALAILLAESVLFCNSRDYWYNGKKSGHTVVLYVLANDFFAPAADAEDLSFNDIKPLYDAWKDEKWLGVNKWLMKKRNLQPWRKVKDRMINKGQWEDWMEKLPANNI